MGFLKNIFGKKEKPITTYAEFWDWFCANERAFYEIVRSGKNTEKGFFDKLSAKLEQLKDGYYYLAGMLDNTTAELVLTADGVINHIVFVEELVEAAPAIPGWKFTALKPEMGIDNAAILMNGYTFSPEKLFFYAVEHADLPDEVDIVIVYDDYKEEDKTIITSGIFIFMDNYLGELNAVTTIDNVTIIPKEHAEKDLIPFSKLKDYLVWREKEFVEKYDGLRYNTENDSYSSLEAKLNNGKPLIAIVNSTLLDWDSKASHPWMMKVTAKYGGSSNNGMPDNETMDRLNRMEEDIMQELKDFDGYLNIGRETADNERNIYFACRDFRKPSKVLHELAKTYSGQLDMTYTIFKDKYWQSVEMFRPV